MFRIGGNINLDDSDIVKGHRFKISVGQRKNYLSFIQYLKPLSPQNPCFTVHLTNISKLILEFLLLGKLIIL